MTYVITERTYTVDSEDAEPPPLTWEPARGERLVSARVAQGVFDRKWGWRWTLIIEDAAGPDEFDAAEATNERRPDPPRRPLRGHRADGRTLPRGPLRVSSMPSPTDAQLASPEFEAVWNVIKSWDVNVPEFYDGYEGASGSHVALILNALGIHGTQPVEEADT